MEPDGAKIVGMVTSFWLCKRKTHCKACVVNSEHIFWDSLWEKWFLTNETNYTQIQELRFQRNPCYWWFLLLLLFVSLLTMMLLLFARWTKIDISTNVAKTWQSSTIFWSWIFEKKDCGNLWAFYTPGKCQKTSGFLTYSGEVRMPINHWKYAVCAKKHSLQKSNRNSKPIFIKINGQKFMGNLSFRCESSISLNKFWS